MLLFFSTILIILVMLILFLLSEVYIEIKNFELFKNDKTNNLKYIIKIRLKFLGIIPIFRTTLSNKKSSKILNKNYINNAIKTISGLNKKQSLLKKQTIFEFILNLHKRMKIKLLKFKINIDTEDVILTSYLVAIISILIPNIIRRKTSNLKPGDYNYKITPIYRNQNTIYLKLNSIISIKVVHIISILKIIGGIKNERSSNRKLNANCYGKC